MKKIPTKTKILLGCIVLCMTACSMRIMYNRLDWIIPIYLDEYVSLTDQQENYVDAAINRFLRWHRTEELPRYIEFVVSLSEAQKESLRQEQVLVLFDRAEGLWSKLLEEALPSLLDLAAALQQEQIQEINDGLQHTIHKLQKKYGNKNQAERRAIWQNKMTDVMQDLLGELTANQAALIGAWSRTKKDTTDDWLVFRDTWRLRFVELLRHRQDAQYRDDMRRLLLQPATLYSASHRQAVMENRHHLAQFIADLAATLTPEQRKHLQQKLSEIIADLQALHGQAR